MVWNFKDLEVLPPKKTILTEENVKIGLRVRMIEPFKARSPNSSLDGRIFRDGEIIRIRPFERGLEIEIRSENFSLVSFFTTPYWGNNGFDNLEIIE